MVCPNCKGIQHCPCPSCTSHRKEPAVTWIWTEDGDHIACGHCNHTMHGEEWADLEYQQYQELKKKAVDNSTEIV